MSGLIFCK